jgi:hypothetical protein
MTDYRQQFQQCPTPTDIKRLYRELAMMHHPDRGGDTATMQAINTAYHNALERKSGTTEEGTDGKTRTYTYNPTAEEAIAAKIYELIGLNLAGVEIWLVGAWVWVKGDTKPHRQALKEAGCFWNSTREAWAWHLPEHRASHAKGVDFNAIAAKYGAKDFTPKEEKKAPARSMTAKA